MKRMTPRPKTRSLKRIESTMETLDQGSYRYRVLDACRRFKNSWMELGEVLYVLHRDKLYRDWDFVSFDAYCSKELGIRKQTAAKLLKSYAFLEKEAPDYIRKAKSGNGADAKVPDLEAINLLRLTKSNKGIDEDRYQSIRRDVFDQAKEAQDLRREIRFLTRGNGEAEQDPRKLRASRRQVFLKRTVRNLEQISREASLTHFLPGTLVEELERLSRRIQKEMRTP